MSPNVSIMRPSESNLKQSMSKVLSREIGQLQSQLNHLIIAKDFKSAQENNSAQLSDNIGDLRSSNGYLNQKVGVFKENNQILDKANKNLREQLVRYQKLMKQLEVEIQVAESKNDEARKRNRELDADLDKDEMSLKVAKAQDQINTESLQSGLSEKRSLDAQLTAIKLEINQNEQRFLEMTNLIKALEDNNQQTHAIRQKTTQETADVEARLQDIRSQSEFLKAEVDELADSLVQKEHRNQTLARQREHLDSLASEFYKLRINYTERLNEQVLAKNMIIKRIMEDNSRLDELSQDADRTLNHIRNIF
jgi:chromosome segregation ATPase